MFNVIRHSFSALSRKVLAVAGLGCLLALPAAQADSSYSFTLDTTSLNGTNGYLAFDLFDGDGLLNNTVTVTGFSVGGGTLTDSSAVVLTNATFWDSILRDLTFGTSLSFSLSLTENFDASGAFNFPDEFVFSLLDSSGAAIPGADPAGASFMIDIDGNTGGAITTFEGLLTPRTSPVPDTGSTLALFGLPLAALAFVSRQRSRRMAAA